MNLFDTTQVALQQAMSGSALRQTALAGNIANANTPNYQRRDVDFHDVLRTALSEGPDAVAHAGFTAAHGPSTGGMNTDSASVMRVDGSGVDIDTENAALAENGMEYEALVAVARGRDDILRSALGVG